MYVPRYSILLPTRNGAAFLAECIDSILSQDHPDFELVVADNANDDATPDLLAGYDDVRLRVVRSEKLLSVTENWTAALDASTGQYLLMVGDDDLLLPGCLAALEDIVNRYDRPDCVSFNGYRYVAPNSVDRETTSYYAAPYFKYGAALPEDGVLSRAARYGLVEQLYALEFPFPLTMQLTLVNRDALGRLPRGLFKSVFPDHYAVCGLLLTAERWALVDRMLVVVGVNPKSFGHFFFNDGDDAGLEYLGNPIAFADQLQGDAVLNATCAWLQETLEDFRRQLPGIEIDRGVYAAQQIRYWLGRYHAGGLDRRDLARRAMTLSSRDCFAMARSYGRPTKLRSLSRAALAARTPRSELLLNELTPLPGITTISEFSRWIGGLRP